MKTKEFIKKVKNLGFEVMDEYDRKGELFEFRIGDDEEDFVVIWPKFTFAISTIEGGFMDLKYPLPFKELYKLCFEYASTPVKDREEEKKFRLKYRWVTYSVWFLYLYRDEDGRMGVSKFTEDIEDRELGRIQVKFTLKEIEDIKKKFDTDLADFELVEVEE